MDEQNWATRAVASVNDVELDSTAARDTRMREHAVARGLCDRSVANCHVVIPLSSRGSNGAMLTRHATRAITSPCDLAQ